MFKRYFYFVIFVAWCLGMLFWAHHASAQSFFKSVHLVETPTTQATAGSTTTLTLASQTVQRFTGSQNETVQLPNATTLSLGMYYLIANDSTGTLTINDGSGAQIAVIESTNSASFRLIANSVSAGTWSVENNYTTVSMNVLSGILPMSKGGTNGNLTAVNGAIVYSDGDSMEIGSVGFSGQLLQSNGAGPYQWTTATFPSTASAPCSLLANTSDQITCLSASTPNRVLRTNGSALSFSQVVLSSDVSGVLPLANGGTNNITVASQGGLAYGTASGISLTAASTSGQVWISQGTAAPVTYNAQVGALFYGGTSGVVSQNANYLFWDAANERLSVGVNASTINSFTVGGVTKGSVFTVEAQGGTNEYEMAVRKNSATLWPQIAQLRARGSGASPSVVQNADILSQMDFLGFDGTDYEYGAKIDVIVDGTPGNNDMPSAIRFWTVRDGTSTPVLASTISQDQTFSFYGSIAIAQSIDSTTSGANQTLTTSRSVLKVTNAGLTSVAGITAFQSKALVLINGTGASITIVNDATATAANRIRTGTVADLSLADKASLFLVYDDNASRWQVIGGSGGSSETTAGTRQTGTSISAGTTITPTAGANLNQFVVGNGGAVTVTATPPFSVTSMVIGQEATVCGTSNTNTVTYNNGNNLVLTGSATLGKDQCLKIKYQGSDGTNAAWVETGRNF